MWKCLRHIAIFWSLTITKIFENNICYLCRHKILTQKNFFFSIWVFFHNHSQITGLQLKGEDISLTPNYHFHSLDRHLDISRAITAKSSPLHIGSSWTRTRNSNPKSLTTKLRPLSGITIYKSLIQQKWTNIRRLVIHYSNSVNLTTTETYMLSIEVTIQWKSFIKI